MCPAYSISTNPLKKNGIMGILNLTNAPKLEVEIATEKAKNTAKIRQNNTKGFEKIEFTATKGFLRKTYSTKINMRKFSTPEINITIFFASHKKGLNNPATDASGNLESTSAMVGSKCPRSNEFPW